MCGLIYSRSSNFARDPCAQSLMITESHTHSRDTPVSQHTNCCAPQSCSDNGSWCSLVSGADRSGAGKTDGRPGSSVPQAAASGWAVPRGCVGLRECFLYNIFWLFAVSRLYLLHQHYWVSVLIHWFNGTGVIEGSLTYSLSGLTVGTIHTWEKKGNNHCQSDVFYSAMLLHMKFRCITCTLFMFMHSFAKSASWSFSFEGSNRDPPRLWRKKGEI